MLRAPLKFGVLGRRPIMPHPNASTGRIHFAIGTDGQRADCVTIKPVLIPPKVLSSNVVDK